MVHADPLEPLRFEPILKRILWGGRRLGSILGKPIGADSDYAESWEVSDHRNGVSRVEGGRQDGKSLRDLLADRGEEMLGPGIARRDQFPLLVKFLDANQVLSVQVHPDDKLGRVLADDNGKTEAWVIVHAEPGSLIYAGLKPGVARGDFARAMETGEVEPLLHRFEPEVGDCVMIPAGTVHAIGAGIVLAEVQQMSDATFRVHDWGRVGADGKSRQLHIRESLESTDFEAGPVHPLRPERVVIEGGTTEQLATCHYFRLDRLRLTGRTTVGADDRFTLLIGLGGSAEIRSGGGSYPIGFGETWLLPASLGRTEVEAVGGEATILTCVVPPGSNSR